MDFGIDSAHAQHHHRPDLGVAAKADDDLGDSRFHALQQCAADAGSGVLTLRRRDHCRNRRSRLLVSRAAQPDAADVGLVRDVGREDLHRRG